MLYSKTQKSLIYQVITALLFSLLMGWIVTSSIFTVNSNKILLLPGFLILCLLIFIACKPFLNKHSFLENLLYLLIISSFFGPAVASVNIGPFSLFPYRLLFLIALPVFFFKYFQKDQLTPWSKINVKNIIMFHVVWVTYALISLIWAKTIKAGIADFVFLVIGISLILFVTFVFKRERDYVNLLYIWVAMFLLLLIFGLINHLTLIHFPTSRFYGIDTYQKSIPTSVFANENDFASFISISFFFALALANHTKHLIVKAGAAGIMLFSLYIMSLTSSRANYIAILLGLVFWFLFLTSRNIKKIIILAGAFIGILAILAVPHKIYNAFISVYGLIATLGNNTEGSSVDIRINLIKNSFHFISESLGFGIGAGNSEYYMKEFALYPTHTIINIHNWWIEMMVNYGIFIFTGYLLIYVGLIYYLFNIFRESTGNNRMIAEALCTALIAFFLASISPSSQITLNYLWLLFAFAIGFINYWRSSQLNMAYHSTLKSEENI
ncbi:O-antigen ligase family protein [Fictibacillus barbaricus]|uniref:Teichuronic acid biosynthesis protein TuaE n=1 Tax=Fictibacillus barbaricus TaxID=182136 RepID=A0ABU1U161_9BACL|nr:O-antigen ligase family protein [Fictibacillus barbaricus]MDR7073168.1 teichuronic acid biosynthesis protein TuaE [Fictibacillus barbaricus]